MFPVVQSNAASKNCNHTWVWPQLNRGSSSTWTCTLFTAPALYDILSCLQKWKLLRSWQVSTVLLHGLSLGSLLFPWWRLIFPNDCLIYHLWWKQIVPFWLQGVLFLLLRARFCPPHSQRVHFSLTKAVTTTAALTPFFQSLLFSGISASSDGKDEEHEDNGDKVKLPLSCRSV